MSAFQVSHGHIDAMLTVAGRIPSCAFTWEGEPGEWRRFDGARTMATERTEIGQMLLTENYLSVSHRYPNGDLPGVMGESFESYEFRPVMEPLSAVAGLKMVRCFIYQACEHPGWEASEANRFCQALTVALIGELPGYADARWEFNRTRAAA